MRDAQEIPILISPFLFLELCPNSYPVFLDNPQTLRNMLLLKERKYPVKKVKKMVSVLGLDAKHQYAGRFRWRIETNVREIEIQAHQGPFLDPARFKDGRVGRAAQSFVQYRYGIMTGRAERFCELDRQILVNIEFHTAVSAGKEMTRSRANSAA
jgi:hypothetical protein